MFKKYTQNLYIYGLSLFINPESTNMHLHFTSKLYLRSATESTLSVCALQALSFHVTLEPRLSSKLVDVARSTSYVPFLNWDFRWRQRNSPPLQQADVKTAFFCQTLHTHHSTQRGVRQQGTARRTLSWRGVLRSRKYHGPGPFFKFLTIEATVQTVLNCYFWLISCSLKDWSSVRIYY